ncbi:hypothetical protein [Halobacillus sp. B23F22_1]
MQKTDGGGLIKKAESKIAPIVEENVETKAAAGTTVLISVHC